VSGLDAAGRDAALVTLRASQINGCGFCTDMHTKDAAHAGETSTRLTWSRPGGRLRCSPMPSALPWSCGAGTRIADAAGGVSDEVWANAAKHYDEDQLAAWWWPSPSSTPSTA